MNETSLSSSIVAAPFMSAVPVPCPAVDSLEGILPDAPLLMMGAGPVPIPATVAHANSVVINHLGDTMARVIHQVKAMAR